MTHCKPTRARLPYGFGESMCDVDLKAYLDELETIAPPCVSGSGRTDGHGKFVNFRGCAFCGREPFRAAHWDYSHLLAALDFPEPWTIARAS